MTEIEMMLNQMNYEAVVNYLKSKYGKVAKDYFTNDTYQYKTQGITRGKEGLYIHHIDEDKAKLCFPLPNELNCLLLPIKKQID